jgi:diacylglycerol kinase (ATP)
MEKIKTQVLNKFFVASCNLKQHFFMEQQKFSWQKRANSFQYAFSGIRFLFRSEHNSWLHAAATVLVIALGFYLKVSFNEAAVLSLAIGLVWIAEFFNTCIEKMMDFISTENHPSIKLIKDVAAGAVLMAAVISIAIGCFIFLPKILAI